jgi:hypothetical protein
MEVDGAALSGFYSYRANREALERLFTAWTSGTLPVAALAEYAYRTNADAKDMMVVILGRLISDSIPDPGQGEWQTLGILGALAQQFGDGIFETPNSSIPIDRLNAESRRVLSSVVFSTRLARALHIGPPLASETTSPLLEPEELFPNGLPNGTIFVTVTPENQVLVHEPGESERLSSTVGVADLVYSRDHPEANNRRQSWNFSALTFALSPTIVIRVDLKLGNTAAPLPQVVQHQTRDADFVPYAKLPESFKAQVQKLVQSRERSSKSN